MCEILQYGLQTYIMRSGAENMPNYTKADFSWILRNPSHETWEADNLFNVETARRARHFHRQLPSFRQTPLVSLGHLAQMMGVEGIYVKDESQRLELNSFKVMGGSFAIFRFLQKKLGLPDEKMTYKFLISKECHDMTGTLTFASATDGNHGKGIAWASRMLGHKCNIYVHRDTSQARIDAIRMFGANVTVVDGNYDDAVRQVAIDARDNGWEIISDTSWPGYTEVPTWIMQGYTTMLLEAQEQFAGMGIERPTHIFVQAGVGALAASVIGFYASLFKENLPKFIVVEPENAACLFLSAKVADGKPHVVTGDLDTIMAGLACGEPSEIAWNVLWPLVDAFLSVPDYVAARGMRILATPLKDDPFVISGESGAVPLGAFYSMMCEKDVTKELIAHLGIDSNSRLLFINTEGNTDPTHFRQIIWDGCDPVPKEYWTTR